MAQTSPRRLAKAGVPATVTYALSAPVRPRRFSRTTVPYAKGRRTGPRSKHQRPVKSSSSTACGGTGRLTPISPSS